jgi:ketosteroid isomerase-like protein
MKKILILLSALALIACQTPSPKRSDAQSIAAIQAVMDTQQVAWNRGDIDGFMQGYWASDSLRFIGKRGITFGWQSTFDNYKKSYPGTEAMGRLQFTNLSMEITGDSSAYVIGKWELFRTADTLSGHYSLLWKCMNGRWIIVADHSS